MHLLLFEALAHLGCQFVEQLPDRAIIKIAGVLRENLSGKNGNRLTMTWRVTSGIGVETSPRVTMPERNGAPRAARSLIHLCAVRIASSRR
jgi:hypothetical protein